MFGKILGKKPANDQSNTAPRLSSAISSSITSAVGKKAFSTMPAAAQKAFKLSTDPNASLRDFVEVIESDEALSARVIKIANSVYFDRGTKTETITDSVVVIGMDELKNLLNATTLTDIFPSKHPIRNQFWTNDIATALIAKALTRRFSELNPDTAFLAGLMHDLGKLLMVQRLGEDYDKVLELVRSEGLTFCEAEEQIFVFNHCEAGQLVAEKWNFSQELVNVIRCHHQSWKESDFEFGSPSLAKTVKAADIIAHALALGHSKGFGRLKNSSEEELENVWKLFKIPANQRRELLEDLKRNFELEQDIYRN